MKKTITVCDLCWHECDGQRCDICGRDCCKSCAEDIYTFGFLCKSCYRKVVERNTELLEFIKTFANWRRRYDVKNC